MTDQSHPISSEDLNAFVDGTISAERRALIEAAIAQQPELDQELNELRATARLLGQLPELRPRRSFALGAEYARPAAAATASPGKIIQLMPIVRSLSIAASLVFMVVAGSLFFDINGDPSSNTELTFAEQNEIMSNVGVTESHGEASDQAEDAHDQAAPAAADDTSHEADEEADSTLTARGDSASAAEAPMEDLTAIEETPEGTAAESSDQIALATDSEPSTSGFAPSGNSDRSIWIWSSVALGGLVMALAGLWFLLVQVGRQSHTNKS